MAATWVGSSFPAPVAVCAAQTAASMPRTIPLRAILEAAANLIIVLSTSVSPLLRRTIVYDLFDCVTLRLLHIKPQECGDPRSHIQIGNGVQTNALRNPGA